MSGAVTGPVASSRPCVNDDAAMRAELHRILSSEEFRSSQRRNRLLTYLVEKAIAVEQVKEYTIGVDVFDKPEDYDPRLDPAVRVEMGRVRAKLADYYSGEGKANNVRLQFPKRSYTPELVSVEEFRQEPPGLSGYEAEGAEKTEEKASRGSRLVSLPVLSMVALLCAAGFVAWRVATRLTLKAPSQAASSKSRPVDPEVTELMLKARARRAEGTRDAFEQAVIYLNGAIRRDPKYADAYADLAGAYAAAAVNFAGKPLDYAAKAKAAAATALQLDPSSSQAYAALGLVDSTVFLNWKLGESEIRRSILLNPRNVVAHDHLRTILLAQGRFEEAAAEAKTAGSLEPLSPINISLGLTYYMARDYDQALAEFIKARDLHPELMIAHLFLGLGWEGKGEFKKALEEYRRCLPQLPEAKLNIAHVLAAMGKASEARAMLAAIEHPESGEAPNAFDVACVYAALGDRDKAFQWLEQSYRDRSILTLKINPMLDPLRGDPRYADLLARAGLNIGG
jgi:tetratricopeptide (TPR) repeat protein